MRGYKKHIIIGAVVIVAAVGVTAGILNLRGRKMQAETTVKQSTITLEKMDLVKSVSATGTIGSKSTKSVTSSVKDVTVGKVLVSVGDTVKKGDTLVTFELDTLQDALEEARESLSDVQSDAAREIASAQKQLNNAIKTRDEEKSRQNLKVSAAKKEKASAKKAVAKAKKKVASAKNAQDKAAGQEELTRTQEALKQAETAYENAVENRSNTNRQNETSVENARTSLENAQSNGNKNIRQARKQMDAAQDSLDDCSVTAPVNGLVTAVNAAEGDSYSGGALLQIDDISSFVVTTSVDEYDISDVKTGQKVVMLTEATDEEELEGEITFVAPSTGENSGSGSQDSSGMSSGSDGYEVQIAVKTEDDRLKLGMTAKCSIIMEEEEDVFAVPYDAVHEKSDGTYVIYVEEDSMSDTTSASGGTDRDNQSGSGDDREDNSGKEIGGRPDFKNESGEENGSRPDFGDGGGFPDSEKEDRKETDGSTGSSGDSERNSSQREVVVEKGMESDYYVAISGEDLYEGMKVIIPTDETAASSGDDKSQEKGFTIPGAGIGNSGDMGRGGNPGGKGGASGQRP